MASTRVRLNDPPKVVVKGQDLRDFKKKLPALTEETVLYLPVFDRAYFVWDLENRKSPKRGTKGDDPASGLGVQVMPTGVKTWRVVYYLHGDQRTIKIGRAGEMTLAEARKRARQIRNEASNGTSPRQGRHEKTGTFAECVNRYIDEYQIAKRRNVAADRVRRILLKQCQRWHDWQINAITEKDIDRLLSEVLRRTPASANLLHSLLGTFMRWCKKKKLITVFPMADIDRPWDGGQRRNYPWFRRELADEVIKGVWAMADAAGPEEGRFAKLILLLGKRYKAIQHMRWEHISPKDWFWNPPAGSRTKKCSPVPLPRLVQRVLGPHKGEGRVLRAGKHRISNVQSAVREHLKIETFVWHGVRHLVETKLAELRVPPHIRDLLLDHAVKRGTGSIYDHHEYEEELLAALEKWAAYVEELVAPGEGVRVLR